MASLHFLLHVLVFFLLHDCATVKGREIQSHVHSISLRSLTTLNNRPCPSTYSTYSESSGKLQLVHLNGPCSPLGTTEAPNYEEILRRDTARVDALHQSFPLSSSRNQRAPASAPASAPSAGVTIPDGVGSALGTLDFIVTVGYGTPPKKFSVIFDTGSDISWIQCEPCVGRCYPQIDPLFDPSQSSTYTNISCSSPDCSLVEGNCDGSNCIYSVQYGDGSYSAGYFAEDTLSLTPLNSLKNFKFGCGEMNGGLFGRIAGLIGLGKGKVSLASQAAPVYGGSFSYCLPSFSNDVGYLTIGNQHLPGDGDNVQYTPMITEPDAPSFYFVELVGLQVLGKSLPIPPAVFTMARTIIDSGTVFTYLPPTAYAALRDEFRRQMTKYQMTPPFSILDTCYNFTGVNVIVIPEVSFEFGNGIRFDCHFSGILYFVDSSLSQGCLAFAATRFDGQFSVIGNVQQRSSEMIYDLDRSMIGFGPLSC